VRLTCEGLLLLCLGREHASDLRAVVRDHPGDAEALQQAILAAMRIKPRGHEFQPGSRPAVMRYMNMTGG